MDSPGIEIEVTHCFVKVKYSRLISCKQAVHKQNVIQYIGHATTYADWVFFLRPLISWTLLNNNNLLASYLPDCRRVPFYLLPTLPLDSSTGGCGCCVSRLVNGIWGGQLRYEWGVLDVLSLLLTCPGTFEWDDPSPVTHSDRIFARASDFCCGVCCAHGPCLCCRFLEELIK